jgi:hypothetical protein
MARKPLLNPATAAGALSTEYVKSEQKERILARQLARELTKDEVEAISGGRMKNTFDDPGYGTISGPVGDMDDGVRYTL